jgi:hypothetical protein
MFRQHCMQLRTKIAHGHRQSKSSDSQMQALKRYTIVRLVKNCGREVDHARTWMSAKSFPRSRTPLSSPLASALKHGQPNLLFPRLKTLETGRRCWTGWNAKSVSKRRGYANQLGNMIARLHAVPDGFMHSSDCDTFDRW